MTTRRFIKSALSEPAEKLKSGGKKGSKLDTFGERKNLL